MAAGADGDPRQQLLERALGYLAEHGIGDISLRELAADDAEIDADGADATRCEFRAADRYGAPRPYVTGQVSIAVEGPAILVGESPFDFASAGGAGAVWIRSRPGEPGTVTVRASHPGLGGATARIRVRRVPHERST